MNTQEIATRLHQHCQNHTEAEGLKELYAPDAMSIEPMAPEGMDPVSKGVEAIQAKHDWWNGAFEVHEVNMEGPFINGDRFTMIFDMDCTEKSSGNRWQGKEVALYEVENGKIARETFMMMPMPG
ncbi:MAG: nuclear transport factor 2 family protein [Paracoccaceae bacterium]|nr:nuclear transport factor 2 family protein [Paracoccaceae bacterium]